MLSDIAPLTLNNAFTNSNSFLVSGTSELTVTGAFGNSGTLHLDTNLYDGGSSLTIGGTLANSGTVQVGNGDLGRRGDDADARRAHQRASTDSFSMYGSASYAATLVFSAAAAGSPSNGGNFELTDIAPLTLNNAFTNSGTFLVSGTSELTVTGGVRQQRDAASRHQPLRRRRQPDDRGHARPTAARCRSATAAGWRGDRK